MGVPESEDQPVQFSRIDWVKASRRLIQKQDLGVESHCAGNGRPFLHTAADVGGEVVSKRLEADQIQLHLGNKPPGVTRKVGKRGERQADVFEQCHAPEEGTALVGYAKRAHGVLAFARPTPLDAISEDAHLTAQKRMEADDVLEEGALATARATELPPERVLVEATKLLDKQLKEFEELVKAEQQ